MARKHSHLSMRRIVLIAVLAIILPSLVLTLVGLKLTHTLKSQLEQSLGEQYAASVAAKVEEIEGGIRELEGRIRDRFAREAAGREPGQAAAALETICEDWPLVDQAFLLQLGPPQQTGPRRLSILYPGEPRPEGLEPFLWGEPLLPRSGKDSIEALRQHRQRTRSPAARARATKIMAARHFREGRYREAAEEYRRLLEEDRVRVLSPSLAVLARYQIGEAQARLESWGEALESFLDLYDDLANGRTEVADATRVTFFLDRALGRIKALLARPELSRLVREEARDRLRPLVAAAERRATRLRQAREQETRRARFLSYLRGFVLPRLQRLAAKGRLEARREGFAHLWDDADPESPQAVAYTALAGEDGRRQVFGFRLNMGYVRGEFLPGALLSSRFGERVGFVVTDRTGARVHGPEGVSAAAATEQFSTVFPSWRLGLVEREPAALRRLAVYNVLLFTVVNGLMIVAIIIGVVITLRGTARELELSQLKSDFVSNVSHELKTPLALIRMFAETLQLGRSRSEEKTREYYSIITRESERLTQLINNVLDFSRIEQGRKTYEMRLDDLADVVRDTLHAFSYELAKEGFAVEADVPDALPDTLMDRNAISLALLNLLSNAVKYSADDRRIRVACGARNGALYLQVADHGIGIDQTEKAKIFDKFYRARSEDVRATRGSGLGLAIVRHSVEAHGGNISVASAPGQGSTFTITLPIRKTLSDGQDSGR
ncbi:MAG: ATP-binding protein [Candidatus Brocadiia bacterium]